MFKPGDCIKNQYLIKSILGKGGQAQVYLCEDRQRDNKLVVVKELIYKSTRESDRKKELVLFEQEAKILQSITHDNLPEVYGIFNENNLSFICEQYIEGTPLDKLLKKNGGRLGEQEALSMGLQLLSLLKHLHGQSPPIIIRDIKPQNIIVQDSGKLYFIDFTIARYMVADKEDTVRMGSPGYAPPEQYRGLSTPRSDLYALGVTLHQILTGHNPISSPFTLPSCIKLRRNIAHGWEDIISRATDLDVHGRYECAEAMEQDLLKIQSRLSSNTSAIPQLLTPGNLLLTIIAVISLLLVAAIVASLILGHKQSEARKREMCMENINTICGAMRIYADEKGSLPTTIETLVPVYLSHLPLCPGARKFTYALRINGEKREGLNGYTLQEDTVFCAGDYHHDAPGQSPCLSIKYRRPAGESVRKD